MALISLTAEFRCDRCKRLYTAKLDPADCDVFTAEEAADHATAMIDDQHACPRCAAEAGEDEDDETDGEE